MFEKDFFKMFKEQEDFPFGVEEQSVEVESTETVQINEYEMCITRGKYSVKVDELDSVYTAEYPFTHYAAFLTNGTPVFWFTSDVTEDGSGAEEQEELALNMAKTLREYDPEETRY